MKLCVMGNEKDRFWVITRIDRVSLYLTADGALALAIGDTERLIFPTVEQANKAAEEFAKCTGCEVEYMEPVKEVRLNDQYTAKITKAGITVGCQTFPLSIVDTLAAAIKELK